MKGPPSGGFETFRTVTIFASKFLFKAVLASLRLAFALVCVGLGLILGAQWFGFIPDSRVETQRARAQTCQTVAIGILEDIRSSRWPKIDSMFIAIVDRDEQLLSIGLRTDSGHLKVATPAHTDCWPQESDQTMAVASKIDDIPPWVVPVEKTRSRGLKRPPMMPPSGQADARVENHQLDPEQEIVSLSVPITVRGQRWGDLEFCFRNEQSGVLGGILDLGLTKFLVFFVVVGMGSYTFLMMRIMGVFTKGQVVPDRVRQALDTLAEGLLVLDEEGKIVLANQNFLSINGFEMDELLDRLASDLPWFFSSEETEAAGDDQSRFPWTRAIENQQSVVSEILRMTGRDGVHRVFSVNAGPIGDDREQKGALVTFQDVTHVEKHRVELENMLTMLRRSKDEIQKKNQELEILATRDALTGCLNRRAFFERMEPLFQQHRQDGRPLSCFMVDVDHFKSVNDTYGHHTGDEVLREVSSALRELHEETQIVCRYGGEEFCVILPGYDLDQAMSEAERTRLAIMNIRLADPESLRLTASIGVSETRFEAGDTQDLINQADECLYVAKRGGRNQSVPYDPDRAVALGEEEEPQTGDIPDPDLVALPFHAVTALVSALAYRDPATAEHSRRVADLCVTSARDLLCQRDIYVLEIAALLHDIGKIGVPDTVLHKPGPLDEQEWKIMRRHNQIGLDIVASTFHCPELEVLIRAHHQLTGLRGAGDRGSTKTVDVSQVSEAARLLCIADTYDSLVSDFAYRKGRSHEEAAQELRRCAGVQFDAELVERFLSRTTNTRQENSLGLPTTRGIAFAVPKQVALKIGQQIEHLAEAMDQQDIDALKLLADDLSQVAEKSYLMPIVDSANKISKSAEASSEEIQWVELLSETQNLMDLCRATQNAHLAENADVS